MSDESTELLATGNAGLQELIRVNRDAVERFELAERHREAIEAEEQQTIRQQERDITAHLYDYAAESRRMAEEQQRRQAAIGGADDHAEAMALAMLSSIGIPGEMSQENVGSLQRDAIPQAAAQQAGLQSTPLATPNQMYTAWERAVGRANESLRADTASAGQAGDDYYGPSVVEQYWRERQRADNDARRYSRLGEPPQRQSQFGFTTESAENTLAERDYRAYGVVREWLNRVGSDPQAMRTLDAMLERNNVTGHTRDLALWYLVCFFRERWYAAQDRAIREAGQNLMRSLEVPLSYERAAAVTPPTPPDTVSQPKKKPPRRMITVEKPDSVAGDNNVSCSTPTS